MVEFDQIRSPLDFVRVITYLHTMLLLIIILCGYYDAPPATPAPGRLAFGQVETANPRGSEIFTEFLNPKPFSETRQTKLNLENKARSLFYNLQYVKYRNSLWVKQNNILLRCFTLCYLESFNITRSIAVLSCDSNWRIYF
jgi:hypothetical protein